MTEPQRRVLTELDRIRPSAMTAAELGTTDGWLNHWRRLYYLVERADVAEKNARCWRISDIGHDVLARLVGR